MPLRSHSSLPGFVLLLSCAVVSVAAFAGDRPSTEPGRAASVEHSAAHPVTFAGIPNFGEVTATLYRGAKPSQQGLAKLADMHVAIVVDLRASRNQAEASAVEIIKFLNYSSGQLQGGHVLLADYHVSNDVFPLLAFTLHPVHPHHIRLEWKENCRWVGSPLGALATRRNAEQTN